MKRSMRIPIRIKILVSLLFVVTAAVSTITFTMANLFHQDKEVYINDIVSTLALAAAEETRTTLSSYADRLRIYGRIASDDSVRRSERASLIEGMFDEFPELIAVRFHEDGLLVGDAHSATVLEKVGRSVADLEKLFEELELEADALEPQGPIVRNASLPGMPALGMGLAVPTSEGERALVASGIISLDGLLRVTERSQASEIFLIDQSGKLLAHRDVARAVAREVVPLGAAAELLGRSGSAAITVEVQRDGVPTFGAFAEVGIGDVRAGAEIPKAAAFLASRGLLRRLLYVAFALLIASAVVGLLWAHRLTRPVETLSRATREIGQGNFDFKVDASSRDEIGDLADSFNRMASELDTRDKALAETQEQLLHSEKMAAFGQLGAGIAHEVKNPLAGILGCTQLVLRKAEKGTTTYQNLELIQKETRRCKTIIESLLKFARNEKAEFSMIDLDPVVEDSIAIVRHQLELKQVHLNADMETGLPKIIGNAGQLQQVLVNLLMNAAQAMDGEPGEVTVTTLRKGPDHLEIVVQDTGPGMPPETRARIFEPFFTTKPGGKGTGLGLSVSFGIIRDHGGRIEVDSDPGQGATFRIQLPNSDAAGAAQPAQVRSA